jgi:hypothetical protein
VKPQSDEEKGADAKDKDKEKDKDKAKDGDKEKDKEKEKGKDEKKAEPPKPVKVDLDGIAARVAAVPIPSGIYGGLDVGRTRSSTSSQAQEARAAGGRDDGPPKVSLHRYDPRSAKTKRSCPASRVRVGCRGQKVLYKAGPRWESSRSPRTRKSATEDRSRRPQSVHRPA